jgi:hypothetical protein
VSDASLGQQLEDLREQIRREIRKELKIKGSLSRSFLFIFQLFHFFPGRIVSHLLL